MLGLRPLTRGVSHDGLWPPLFPFTHANSYLTMMDRATNLIYGRFRFVTWYYMIHLYSLLTKPLVLGTLSVHRRRPKRGVWRSCRIYSLCHCSPSTKLRPRNSRRMDLQPEPLLAVDEAPAKERPRLLVGERPGPRHPLPRARPWTLAAVLPEQHRPVQK